MKKIPRDFQGILWSTKVDNLDLQEDKNYIIHQILAYGSLEQIKWLFKNYPKEEIIDNFVNSPRKNYTPAAFNFIKNFILDLEKQELNPEYYVKTIF